jgi:hypothetical protein
MKFISKNDLRFQSIAAAGGVELYLGGAGERLPASSSPTWGARGRVGAVVGQGRRRTGEGGGRGGINVEMRQPGGGGPAREAAERPCRPVVGRC